MNSGRIQVNHRFGEVPPGALDRPEQRICTIVTTISERYLDFHRDVVPVLGIMVWITNGEGCDLLNLLATLPEILGIRYSESASI